MYPPIFGVDVASVNYYKGFKLDRIGMRKHGFRYAMIKVSMGGGKDCTLIGGQVFDTVEFFFNYFRSGGFDTAGAYHWTDQTQDMVRQIGFLIEQVKKFKPDAIVFDDEQDWDDWAQWYAAVRHEISWDQVRKSSPAKILKAMHGSIAELERQLPAERRVPVLMYLYSYFLETYCGAPAAWPFPECPRPHLAAYVQLPAEHVICETWGEFMEYARAYVVGKSPITYTRGRPAGLGPDDWTWWQWQSGVTLPGARFPLDLNYFNGDGKAYAEWLRRRPVETLIGWEMVRQSLSRIHTATVDVCREHGIYGGR